MQMGTDMKKEVRLTISGLHADAEAEHANVETVVDAEYYKRGDSHYLLYEEMVEGFKEPSRNRIKFKDNLMELTRQGVMGTHMIFEENKTHMTPYNTPFGQLVLGVSTSRIEVQEQEKQILVSVDYQLESEGEMLTDSRIALRIVER